MEEIRRAKNPLRIHIPEELVPALRALRARQTDWRELIEREDVVHLFYGLGPAGFLTFDGRIIVDSSDWIPSEGTYEVEDTEPETAWKGFRIAAKNFHCPELLQLLPTEPREAIPCPVCHGHGMMKFKRENQPDMELICGCHGLGWI
ncbi:MAG: hypothetical protein KDA68_09855 [Planctomycetaceae bacterium]|nr:hypothetical protein [Planctomycetaceae bacterium]